MDRHGEVIAQTYALGEEIGTGGMGVVYEAEVIGWPRGQIVAIKLLLPKLGQDADAARRLRAEATAAAAITHPNVVAVLDVSPPDAPLPFVVMERVRGTSLGALLRETGPLSLRRSTEIARQILAGLAATHSADVVHADIKTENIVVEVSPDGRDVVKIIDFGLAAKRTEVGWTVVPQYDRRGRRVMSGTPEYMAPEIVLGKAAVPASDLYAVGVIVYEMLTGEPPFVGGTSSEILERHVNDQVIPPSLRSPDRFIPFKLERVVMTALEKDPDERYDTAAAFATALDEATPATETVLVARTTTPGYTVEATTRHFSIRAPRRKMRFRHGNQPRSLDLRYRLRSELAVVRGRSELMTRRDLARGDAHAGRWPLLERLTRPMERRSRRSRRSRVHAARAGNPQR
jgi:serine/threonine protein kinase